MLEEANSFPSDTVLTESEAWDLFSNQTETVCVVLDNHIVGVYILHPNNIGRCSHIANASYAVSKVARGMGIGKKMVIDSIERCKKNRIKRLQYNAVLVTNYVAISLYLKLGFTIIGTIQNGYR